MDFGNYFFLTPKSEKSEKALFDVNEFQDRDNWHEEYMEYEKLHKKTEGKSQIIALIDSGISPFQKSKVKKSFTLLTNSDEFDENGHGTMMCSLILGDNKLLGIAPEAKVYSYKVVDESGKINPKILSYAIDKAVKDEVNIINISLGSYYDNKKVKKAINNAIKSGIIIVASSGDYETEDMLYPAWYKGCISVGAIDKELTVWKSTNAIDQCDILAPGVNVNTLLNTGELAATTGTSQSTALISGYIALLKDYALLKDIDISTEQVKKILNNINHKKITYLDGLNELK